MENDKEKEEEGDDDDGCEIEEAGNSGKKL
jgi:hypothetical protein